MADPTEDELTSEQSNLEAAEDQTAESTEQQDQDNGAEDSTDAAEGEVETPTRSDKREARHERYIDKLGAEIRASAEIPDRTDELFAPRPYEPLQYKEGDQLDPEALEQDRKQVADNKFAEGLSLGYRQGTDRSTLQTFDTRLDVDSERVAQKWDILDPSKPDTYRPNMEKRMVQDYIDFVGMEKDQQGRLTIRRPNVRYRDFVDAKMQEMEDYAAAKADKSSSNIASQAAKTGLRPGSQARVAKNDHGFDTSSYEAAINSLATMSSEQYHKLGGKEASDAYFEQHRIGLRK